MAYTALLKQSKAKHNGGCEDAQHNLRPFLQKQLTAQSLRIMSQYVSCVGLPDLATKSAGHQ